MEWTCACGMANSAESKFCNRCGAPEGPAQPVAPQPPAPPAPQPAAAPPRQPVPAARPVAPKPKKKGGCAIWVTLAIGFLLVFCLIAAAVMGVIYWKNKGNIRDRIREKFQGGAAAATDDSKQQAAQEEMSKVAAALEAFKTDKGAYPSSGHNPDSYYTLVDLEAIQSLLVPDYIPALQKDPWGNAYEYGPSQDDQAFVLVCKGSDGEDKLQSIPDTPVETQCYEDEIVLENGQFIQKPGGQQKSCSSQG
jgi:hypothetical protein